MSCRPRRRSRAFHLRWIAGLSPEVASSNPSPIARCAASDLRRPVARGKSRFVPPDRRWSRPCEHPLQVEPSLPHRMVDAAATKVLSSRPRALSAARTRPRPGRRSRLDGAKMALVVRARELRLDAVVGDESIRHELAEGHRELDLAAEEPQDRACLVAGVPSANLARRERGRAGTWASSRCR